jgi:hypothetical protein
MDREPVSTRAVLPCVVSPCLVFDAVVSGESAVRIALAVTQLVTDALEYSI